MTPPALSIRGISLDYPVGASTGDSLLTTAIQRVTGRNNFGSNTFHALKNVSINCTSGDRIALLGKNGAGKSSLLKAIAGIYPITEGEIYSTGSIQAILELSLGFEPDATGRQNIDFRSYLLGLTPPQISQIKQQIIEFAALGEFLDKPVKTYSSGMLLRLAFAITTAAPSDILLLDEVIGAGDASFAEKAGERLGKMIGGSGIVILASHSSQTLRQHCDRGIVLSNGGIEFDGDLEDAIDLHTRACNA
ncbi:ATP-binding cassette domain-containing protein [Luminiphilus sp.]|nr:ATP-binding cassette domain-containing protein [Luminiphilus sp.]